MIQIGNTCSEVAGTVNPRFIVRWQTNGIRDLRMVLDLSSGNKEKREKMEMQKTQK